MTNREIDALIAEKITRHECDNCGSMADCGCEVTNIGSGLPRFSTDPAASKQLRDKMRADGWLYFISAHLHDFACEWWKPDTDGNFIEKSDTEEMAVALAALKAVGVEL